MQSAGCCAPHMCGAVFSRCERLSGQLRFHTRPFPVLCRGRRGSPRALAQGQLHCPRSTQVLALVEPEVSTSSRTSQAARRTYSVPSSAVPSSAVPGSAVLSSKPHVAHTMLRRCSTYSPRTTAADFACPLPVPCARVGASALGRRSLQRSEKGRWRSVQRSAQRSAQRPPRYLYSEGGTLAMICLPRAERASSAASRTVGDALPMESSSPCMASP